MSVTDRTRASTRRAIETEQRSVGVVPDIHADAGRLAAALEALDGVGTVAFLGDFIDAGRAVDTPDDAAVLEKARELVEAGRAVAVMGNHELNAILFHRQDEVGRPLRAHSEKNLAQHRSFVGAFGIGTSVAREWTDWFLSLPLWLDLGGLRLVHAYWGPDEIATVAERRPDARLREEDLPEVARGHSAFARAVNLLVSGPEAELPAGWQFRDAGGHVRRHVRLAWWRATARTWREAALSVPDPTELPDDLVEGGATVSFYSSSAPPVLVGHYKMTGAPRIEAPQAACLDFPRAPCVYRWGGERHLSPASLDSIR